MTTNDRWNICLKNISSVIEYFISILAIYITINVFESPIEFSWKLIFICIIRCFNSINAFIVCYNIICYCTSPTFSVIIILLLIFSERSLKMSKESFRIISTKTDCTILKSKYHYWRILKRDNMYFLHHKHNENDNFHIQVKKPFYNLTAIYKYILSHDKYYDKLNHK